MPYESYFSETANWTAEQLLVDWRWLIGDNSYSIFKTTALGDLFLTDVDGVICFLDTINGMIAPFATGGSEFSEKLEDRAARQTMLGSFVVRGLLAKGMRLNAGECFSPEHPPILGGKLSSDNLVPCSLLVHSSIMGQVHKKVRDLPRGTNIASVDIDNP